MEREICGVYNIIHCHRQLHKYCYLCRQEIKIISIEKYRVIQNQKYTHKYYLISQNVAFIQYKLLLLVPQCTPQLTNRHLTHQTRALNQIDIIILYYAPQNQGGCYTFINLNNYSSSCQMTFSIQCQCTIRQSKDTIRTSIWLSYTIHKEKSLLVYRKSCKEQQKIYA